MNFDWKKILLFGSFIFYLGSLLLRQETAINQDLGRHLRLGEMIFTGGEQRTCALYKNCLTYTEPDYPFVNHHWGAEIIFYIIYKQFGFSGLIILKTLILGITFLVITLHAAKGPTRQLADRTYLARLTVSIAITFLAIQMMATRLTMRPEIFGYLLFSLLFWILNRYKDRLPRHPAKAGILAMTTTTSLIILIWVNLHISFIFGLLLIWIWAVASSATRRRGGDPPHTIFALPIIATFVTLFNPSGLRGALMPLNILKEYGYTIAENMTPFFLADFKPQPEYAIYAFCLVSTTVLFFKAHKKLSLFEIAVFTVFSVFPLFAVRHLPFFALAIVPFFSPLITQALSKFRASEEAVIGLSATLLILACTNPTPLAYGILPPTGLSTDTRHDAAVTFVKEQNLTGNMWNNYDIGSYLEWKLPTHKPFVDGRPEAFSVEFFKNTYIPMQQSQEIWDQEVAQYDIQWAFAALTDATPWFQSWWAMIQKHPAWDLVYRDKFTAVLVHNGRAR